MQPSLLVSRRKRTIEETRGDGGDGWDGCDAGGGDAGADGGWRGMAVLAGPAVFLTKS